MPYHLLGRVSKAIYNNSTNGDPDEAVPLFAVVTLFPLGALYICARMYIIRGLRERVYNFFFFEFI